MKYLLLLLILESVSFAKVQDFNAIINEDIKAQKELHQQFKHQVNLVDENTGTRYQVNKAKTQNNKRDVIVVESNATNYIAPSRKNFLKFKKEIHQKSQNDRKNQHRVANEIKELEF